MDDYMYECKQMQYAIDIFHNWDAFEVTVKYPNLSNKSILYCTYLTFFLSCRSPCTVHQRLFTNGLNEGVPLLCREPWLFLNTKSHCSIFVWPRMNALYLIIIICLHWSWKAPMGSGQFIEYNDTIQYTILWKQSANQQKRLRNDAFHVKTTLSFFVV